MKKILQYTLLVLTSVMFFSGCMMVKSHVSVFHVLPESPMHTEYAFSPFEDQRGSLEYESYKGLIRNELLKYQYVEVPLSKATVLVFFQYGIDGGKTINYSIPTYGQTGVKSSYTTGSYSSYGNYGTYSGTTTYTPTYGITGSKTASRTEYSRHVTIEILDKTSLENKKIKKLYTATANSEGKSSQIAAVMPAIIEAIFKKFPGKSGSTRREISSMSK